LLTADQIKVKGQLKIIKAIEDESEVNKTRVTVTPVSDILTLTGHGLDGEIKEVADTYALYEKAWHHSDTAFKTSRK
jgi:hypothetical protein